MPRLRLLLPDWVALTAIALALWLAWFSRSTEFGFYEDDYSTITPHLYGSWSSVSNQVTTDVLRFRQGKPLCYVLMPVLARISGMLGGKSAAYALAFLILTMSSFLAYALFRRIQLGRFLSLAGALAFALGPADTSRAFLCHAFGFQTGFVFLWIALHAHLSKRTALAWVFAILAFLVYEPLIGLFWAAAFLVETSNRRHEVLRQGTAIALVLLIAFAVRLQFKEPRAADVTVATAAAKVALNLNEGPKSALRAWAEAAASSDGRRLILFVLFAGLLLAFRKDLPEISRRKLLLLALFLVAVAYCFDLLNDPSKIHGRASRIHSPAGLGLSLLFVAVGAQLLRFPRGAWVTGFLYAWIFSGWVAFGQRVQADYAGSWKSQQNLWRSFAEQTADLKGQERILLDFPEGTPEFKEAAVLGWSLNLTSRQIFRYTGGDSPRLKVIGRREARRPAPEDAVVLRWHRGAFTRIGRRGKPARRIALPFWRDVVS